MTGVLKVEVMYPGIELLNGPQGDFLRRKRFQKPKDQKQAARIFRQLMRAGFGSKTIFAILKKWDIDDETLTTLESETLDQAG